MRSCGSCQAMILCLAGGLLAVQLPAAHGQVKEATGLHAGSQAVKIANALVEVLTRGPVHEAFAEPVNLGRGQAAVITRRPPPALAEVPPEWRPDSENVAWIPGYWSWDGEEDDFLWVSGVWRVPPPGMQWIGGYWAEVAGGHRWVSGFWIEADAKDIHYYPPPPPANPEEGSGAVVPSPADFWTPGGWTWHDDGFAWKAGYWARARPGRIWVPGSYLWTPRGYILSSGYWDYTMEYRGMLFAPLAVSPAAYQDPDFIYSPNVAIDPALLSFYLFVRPAYGHYYFGDYFADEYVGLGIYPWYIVTRFPDYHYDPLLAYDRWYNRTRDPKRIDTLEKWNAYYRRHPEARPPRDLAAEQRLASQLRGRVDREFLMIGRPLDTVWQKSVFPLRLARLSPADQNRVMQSVRSTRDFQGQRSRMETVAAGRSERPSATLGSAPPSASDGPQKATLPHRDQTMAALHDSTLVK